MGCLLIVLAGGVGSRAEDSSSRRFETVTVSADSAWEESDIDAVHFSGNCRIQGRDWELTADKAVVHGPLDNPRRIEATGSPARIILTSDADSKYQRIDGEAEVLEYWRDPETIKLSGSAVLRRDSNVLHSGEIEYVRDGNKFKAGGQGGVRLTLDPKDF